MSTFSEHYLVFAIFKPLPVLIGTYIHKLETYSFDSNLNLLSSLCTYTLQFVFPSLLRSPYNYWYYLLSIPKKLPVSRLYKIEGKENNANSDILNKDNVNKSSDYSENTSNTSKREVAIIG